jgi:hypothetical protein
VDIPRTLNIVGLSAGFAGGFLLSVEALRIARVMRAADALANVGQWIGDPIFKEKPLPLTWRFAASCAAFCVASWIWAPFLMVWTFTPALFVAVFVLHRFVQWSVAASHDGFAAVVGFILVTLGTAIQLAAIFA